MAEYIARGAARKIMADTGDQEQLMFYEPFLESKRCLYGKEVKDNGQLVELKQYIARVLIKANQFY